MNNDFKIFDNFELPVFIIDKKQNIIYKNERLCKILFHDLITDRTLKEYEKLKKYKKLTRNSFFIKLENRRTFKITVSFFKSYLIFTVEDRTNIEDFIDKFFVLNAIITQAPIGIIITDKHGNINFVNKGFERISQFKFDEIYGKNPRIWKSEKHSKEFYKNLWNTLLSGNEWKGEFINRRKDGSLYIDESLIFPIFDETGAISGFCGIKQDITELKKLKDSLLQAEKLVTIGRTVQSIAHDMKNMLTGITTLIDYLKAMENDESKRAMIDKALNYLNILNEFVNNLKKSEVTEIDKMEKLHICKYISNMLTFYKHLVGKNITIKFDCKECASILINTIHLEQILLNLIVNAKDAIREKFGDKKGGMITIKIDLIDDNLLIAVEDNGKGIPDKIKDKIFSLSFTTKKDSTGLGLSIIKNIVSHYDGKVEVESTEGEGTKFSITLPLYDKTDKCNNSIQKTIEY